MTSQEFIGIICEEYRQRTGCEEESTNPVIYNSHSKPPKPNLVQHIGNTSEKWCLHCKHKNHNNTDCHFLNDTSPCGFCSVKGHIDQNCQKKRKKEKQKEDKGKRRKSEDNGGGDPKRQKKDIVNVVEDEIISFLVTEEGQDFNYNTFDVLNSLAMDECVSYYDDLVVDTGATSHISHICNQHAAFTTYQTLADKIFSGVGGLKTTPRYQNS